MCDQVERIEALSICNVRVRSPREQQVDDIEMAIPSGPLQRRSLELAPDRINLGATVEQPATGADMRVDCCPV